MPQAEVIGKARRRLVLTIWLVYWRSHQSPLYRVAMRACSTIAEELPSLMDMGFMNPVGGLNA